MHNLRQILGTRNNVDAFNNRAAAFRYADKCHKIHVVILGDNSQFWVCSFADAQKLVKDGYELAK